MGNCFPSFEGTSERTVKIGSYEVHVVALRGHGGFSDVFEVEDTTHKKTYAMKKMLCQTPERLEMAKNEIKYMGMFTTHPNLIHLYASEVDEITQRVYMLMDWHPDTIDKLKQDNRHPDERTVLKLFLGVCKGLREMHESSPPLAHRDIKPANVLLAADFTPVLMDFGSVGPARPTFADRKQALAFQEACEEGCSIMYRAPELFDVNPDTVIDERSDIWSLGGTLYASLYLVSPFDSAYYQGSVKLAALSGNLTFPPDSRFSSDVQQLIRDMMTVDITKRLWIQDVVMRVDRLLEKLLGANG